MSEGTVDPGPQETPQEEVEQEAVTTGPDEATESTGADSDEAVADGTQDS